ncbi:regulator of chromosome condensation 1/beta-lactamase-inhibitor protein II [Aspergillus avenaceus]|uniref:Regulator of chromosome condensation 1/beta-lactamase-inhibitor protein II n=1 Tax=Aspergillus avenaceus TaxID=36643 RepID=A0A5N6TY25_ASPAV|nr:regulator of chromosome condensation 1/beta-lactamase-inhibitor protein II [Aspergillus avenaceus]
MPLYAFGSNGSGQLGIGHDEDVSMPTKCLFEYDPAKSTTPTTHPENRNVRRIAAGGNHTLVLFDDGSVYASGLNEDGRCGVRPGDVVGVFRRVEFTWEGRLYDSFTDVGASWEASFFVAGGRVFVSGSGGKGELGLGEGVGFVEGVREVGGLPGGVVGVSCGMGHCVVVLGSGEVFGWGGARKGQLGEGARGGKIAWRPVRIEVGLRVEGVACGREFTVLTGSRGEIEILGAEGDKWKILSGRPVLDGWQRVAASWHGVYVHLCEGGVVAWGRNDRGQLPVEHMPKVKEMAVGSEHALALLGDGAVVAFGWGEHGNCGPVADAQGNVREYMSIPLPGGKVVGIGAGCATSWIVVE